MLLDPDGRTWARQRRLTVADARRFVRRAGPVAVADGDDEPVTWLTAAEGRSFWERVEPHVEAVDAPAPDPDDDGLTYLAELWSHGRDRLVVVQVVC